MNTRQARSSAGSRRSRASAGAPCSRVIAAEPLAPGDSRQIGALPAAGMTPRAVKALRDRCGDKIEAGNFRVRVLRALFRWALDAGHVDRNPARDVPLIRTASEGFATWTPEHVRAFESRWPVGTRQRLAMALLFFTGARRSDAVALGRQHLRDGWLCWTAYKGRNRAPVRVEIPLLPELDRIIAASPTGDMTYLVTQFGRPYTPAGLTNAFRRWCDAAGLQGLSPHGLRKAGACIAAENGASEHQLMAIFGWKTAKQAAVYTRNANRRRTAGEAIGLIRLDGDGNETGPNVSHGPDDFVSHS